MIIAAPDTLTQLGLAAAIKNNVLVIVGRGCRLSVSKRRFYPVSFPGLDGVEARLVRFGEGEIVINKTVLIDRKSTRLNSSHSGESRMPSSA